LFVLEYCLSERHERHRPVAGGGLSGLSGGGVPLPLRRARRVPPLAHYRPIKGFPGDWHEPTTKSRWCSPHWLEIESGGEHLMVQATLSTNVLSGPASSTSKLRVPASECSTR
jgi:hypothetical protein